MLRREDSAEEIADVNRLNYGALLDLVIIMAVLVCVKQAMLPLTMLYAGPISTFTAMAVGTYLLRRRGSRWYDLGLRWPENWWKAIGLTVLAFFLFVCTMQLMQIVAEQFFEDIGTSGRFSHVEGNLPAYIGMMVLVWTHGSFFEELLFRAFIITKASTFMGGGWKADIVAVIFSAIFFGYRHYYYQGMRGALITGAAGLAFGLFYLWFGRRNILPLVFAHGIMNSLAQTFRYLGIKT